jgi:teichuronic acid biosynthesis glycosyltransferase TuaC
MNILVLTTLYPNNVQHRHGVFIENRVKELVKCYPEAKVRVIAPVPYFPSWLPIKEYQQYSKIALQETRSSISVLHPRYFVIPKIGMYITPYFLYRTCLTSIAKIQEEGFSIDVIDSHYFYPDGVVASWIGEELDIPVMVTARGSDINVIPDNSIARQHIVKALTDIQASAAVSQALADEMVKLAPLAKQPVVLKNGVDLDLFHPDAPEPTLPFKLESGEKLILSVGNLIELKGHHLVIKALGSLDKVKLIVIGEGEYKSTLQKLVEDLSLTDRVYFIGNIMQAHLPGYYATADAVVLASSREGMPNVLLESLACGTRVIATNVGGIKELIGSSEVGTLLSSRSTMSIVEALLSVLSKEKQPKIIRLYAQQFGWKGTTDRQYSLLQKLVTNKRG